MGCLGHLESNPKNGSPHLSVRLAVVAILQAFHGDDFRHLSVRLAVLVILKTSQGHDFSTP
eukprot:2642549-Karenia_brevis.AAC.1